jgi:hypothetical protein
MFSADNHLQVSHALLAIILYSVQDCLHPVSLILTAFSKAHIRLLTTSRQHRPTPVQLHHGICQILHMALHMGILQVTEYGKTALPGVWGVARFITVHTNIPSCIFSVTELQWAEDYIESSINTLSTLPIHAFCSLRRVSDTCR